MTEQMKLQWCISRPNAIQMRCPINDACCQNILVVPGMYHQHDASVGYPIAHTKGWALSCVQEELKRWPSVHVVLQVSTRILTPTPIARVQHWICTQVIPIGNACIPPPELTVCLVTVDNSMYHQQLQQTVCQTIVSTPQLTKPTLVATVPQPRNRLFITRRQMHIKRCLAACLITHTKD